MRNFACILLIFTNCSAEPTQKNEDLIKRDLEHRRNLAILASINLEHDAPLNILSPNPSTIEKRKLPSETSTHQIYSGEHLPAPVSLANNLPLEYAPAHGFPLPGIAFNAPGSNFDQFLYGHPLETYSNNVIPQQSYQVQAPQQHPVNVIRTVAVPVPVEVPRPYEVRVPHPVPVPIHIRVPVPVDKPYPVKITKTVAVPVEKPVYIKVPQLIEVPVLQPYPVNVPQRNHNRAPVEVSAGSGLSTGKNNLDGILFVPTSPVTNTNIPGDHVNLPSPVTPPSVNLPPFNVASTLFPPIRPSTVNKEMVPKKEPSLFVTPVSAPSTLFPPIGSSSEVVPTKRPPLSVTIKPNRHFTGNGLLPPPPPTKMTNFQRVVGGLLNSYVSSKGKGSYRPNTRHQTVQFRKSW